MSDYPMLISNKLHSFRNFAEQRYKASKVRNEIMCKMVSYSDLKLHKPLLVSQFFRILAT